MFLYADPRVCPACRAPLPYGSSACPACAVPLTGEVGGQVYAALQHVDGLVARLREQARVPADASPPRPADAATRPREQRGLSAASVPKILLSLGALCLLVAAAVFLAVAWALLDVHGRTLVLIGMTALAGALGAVVARRGLRAGAESFATVALGLVVVDVVGARSAGWLGDPGWAMFLLVVGVAVAAPAATSASLARRTPVERLLAPEIAFALAVAVATVGIVALPPLDADAGVLGALLTAVAATVVARGLGLRSATPAVAVVAAGWWLALVVRGVDRLPGDLSFAQVWQSGAIWVLLVAALLPVPVALLRSLPVAIRVAATSASVAVGTGALTLVSYDESATVVSLVELAVVAATLLVGLRLAGAWRMVVVAPATVAALALWLSGLGLLTVALEALLDIRVWGEDLAVAVDVPDLAWSWPLLLPAAGLAVLAAGWLAARCVVAVPGRAVAVWAVPVAIAGLALVPTLYGVPHWLALAALAAGIGAAAAAALATGRLEPLAAAAALGLLLLLASLADPWSTAATLGALTALAVVALLRHDPVVASAGGIVAPLAGSGLLWTVQHLAEVPEPWRGVAVLVSLGLFLLARPGLLREVPAYVAGALTVIACVGQPDGLAQGWLAVHLTIAGAALTAVALVHDHRRSVGWGGLGLLTAAQWVRLEQLGVETVEAYTLPLGVVLLGLGLVRLRTSDVTSTRALGAGLSLALVPTLLQVLLDPVGLRAALLGAACVASLATGAAMRWSAPLVAGATVGALLVLREAQHASVVREWVAIGAIGLLLTVVGITWERRLAEIRAAVGYVRRLR